GGSASAAVGLALTDNLTEAYIGHGALVRSATDVEVLATAGQDVLLFSAGFNKGAAFLHFILPNFGGSFPVAALGSAPPPYVDAGATVDARGNVAILARDHTDIDLIGGSATLSSGYTGVGVSGVAAIVNKDTRAYVGAGATVDAGGNVGEMTVLA